MGDRKTSFEQGTIYVGLAIWIAAAALAAWLTLWFVSGGFLGSLLAVLAPMAFFAGLSSRRPRRR